MEQKIVCEFCFRDAVKQGEYYICNYCKTVCLPEGDSEETYKTINKYLNETQTLIDAKHNEIRALEENKHSKSTLTSEENRIYDCLSHFQSLKEDLSFIIYNGLSLSNESTHKKLYELLSISDELEKILNS